MRQRVTPRIVLENPSLFEGQALHVIKVSNSNPEADTELQINN